MRCGTRGAYVHGCRCGLCTQANTDYIRQWKESRPLLAPDDPRHGTANGYNNWNCRCPACTTAKTTAQKTKRAKRRAA